MHLKQRLNRSTAHLLLPFLFCLAIAILQFLLPWMAYNFGGHSSNTSLTTRESWHGYFARILQVGGYDNSTFLSAAAQGRELCVLIKKRESRASPFISFQWWRESNEIVRFNLHTGETSRHPAPNVIQNVVSNSERMFWTSTKAEHALATVKQGRSFLFEGRPTCIRRAASGTTEQLQELEDHLRPNRARQVGPDVLIPDGIAIGGLNVILQSGNVFLLIYQDSGFQIFSRTGLPIATDQMAAEFKQKLPLPIQEYSAEQLANTGWTCIRNNRYRYGNQTFGEPFSLEPFGFWFEGSQPLAIALERDDGTPGGYQFRWCRFRSDKDFDTGLITSPIPFPDIHHSGWFEVVISPEGPIYVVAGYRDGRMHVLKWDQQNLKLIAQCGSPTAYADLCELLFHVSLTTVLPMCLLVLFVWQFQRKEGGGNYSFGLKTVSVSTAARRAFARSIDLSCLLLPLALACFLNPNTYGWWRPTRISIEELNWNTQFIMENPAAWFEHTMTASWRVFLNIVLVPVDWRVLIFVTAVFVTQTLWQATKGLTIGKWLMGIKVLQTSLRPCGLARSFLREILLVVDSTLLLSWAPGVLFILATKQHQRLGDLLADTIVIDARQRKDQI